MVIRLDDGGGSFSYQQLFFEGVCKQQQQQYVYTYYYNIVKLTKEAQLVILHI
jgi:hypothetical protein